MVRRNDPMYKHTPSQQKVREGVGINPSRLKVSHSVHFTHTERVIFTKLKNTCLGILHCTQLLGGKARGTEVCILINTFYWKL
jgi:hypothetical protein